MLPTNVSACRRLLKCDGNMFTKYTCCVKCCEVYPLNESVEKTGTKTASKRCSYVEYPDHPLRTHSGPCGAVLMKEVKLRSKQFFYPFKVFCYKSLIESIREFCSRSGFIQRCELWRNRVIKKNVYSDIYDGEMWRNFAEASGEHFFSSAHNLGLMLNIDWFQPYKHILSTLLV